MANFEYGSDPVYVNLFNETLNPDEYTEDDFYLPLSAGEVIVSFRVKAGRLIQVMTVPKAELTSTWETIKVYGSRAGTGLTDNNYGYGYGWNDSGHTDLDYFNVLGYEV